ncbi:carbonic anhydrase family protein [Chryseobacterium sp. MMS23-Vi53]|uniref:carbonic anhydrase family protein n=1 Tax=Chryseobacterium sp. MMS23-Vi53 TaxID=3386644 RepID=UPI0039ED100A
MICALLVLNFINAQNHWSYEGEGSPEHWGEILGNEKCSQGKTQSPINISTLKVVKGKNLKKIDFKYDLGDVKDIQDNGHSLQFDFEDSSFIKYENKKYALIQFHGHEKSEHTIDGIHYPLELHFVHKALDGLFL